MSGEHVVGAWSALYMTPARLYLPYLPHRGICP